MSTQTELLSDTLSLAFPKGRQSVSIKHIVRLEGQINYTQCFFSDGSSLLVALTMKVLIDRMPPNTLVRLHRRHAVNPGYVVEWNQPKALVRLNTGDQISIARRRNGVRRIKTLARQQPVT